MSEGESELHGQHHWGKRGEPGPLPPRPSVPRSCPGHVPAVTVKPTSLGWAPAGSLAGTSHQILTRHCEVTCTDTASTWPRRALIPGLLDCGTCDTGSLNRAGLLFSGDQGSGYGQMAPTALLSALGSEECLSPSLATPGPLWTHCTPTMFPLCHPQGYDGIRGVGTQPPGYVGSWHRGYLGTCIFKLQRWPTSAAGAGRATGYLGPR